MKFEETLELAEEAIFRQIPQNLSSRDKTWVYLAIAVGTGLAIWGIYELGKRAGEQQARLIKPQIESERLKADADKTKKS